MKIDGQGSDYVTGVISNAYTNSSGKAGTVEITVAGLIELLNGAEISSSTWSTGDAGNVNINAGEMKIDRQGNSYVTGVISTAETGSSGKAGTVEITVAGLIELLNGAIISSSTWSTGDAGNVNINAGNMKIDGQGSSYVTGVISNASTGSSGKAGTVDITIAGLIELLNGAEISSKTWSIGDAGEIKVAADDLIIDSGGIFSDSTIDATGNVGNVSVSADSITLLNRAGISIKAIQTLSEEQLAAMPEKSITLNIRQLSIESESRITSESTGNTPASDINVNAATIYLHNGLITTSVESETGNGNGGNITISGITNDPDTPVPADYLVMQNGFIQANTNASDAEGGRIVINADALIKESDASLEIGGDEIQKFVANSKRNIIQAAAPEGNPKNDDIQTPAIPIDIGSSIVNMGAKFSEPAKMSTNHCLTIGTKRASSLIECGKGWIPEQPEDASSISFDQHRLDELLLYQENM